MNKADLRRLALEVRVELGLGPLDVLDPYALAALYGVDVIPLSGLGCSPGALRHFTIVRPEVFSGALVPLGSGTVIVENDRHSLVRRRSTLGHELAHHVLEHTFDTQLVNEDGCRTARPEDEDAARELGAELLLTAQAARALARRGATDEEAARRYQVSVAFARWRLAATGARKIAAHVHNKRTSPSPDGTTPRAGPDTARHGAVTPGPPPLDLATLDLATLDPPTAAAGTLDPDPVDADTHDVGTTDRPRAREAFLATADAEGLPTFLAQLLAASADPFEPRLERLRAATLAVDYLDAVRRALVEHLDTDTTPWALIADALGASIAEARVLWGPERTRGSS